MTSRISSPVEPSAGWKTWLGFSAMALGMFLAILDIQIVASSLVDIQFDLHIPGDRLSYIQTIYLIAEVIAIALTGWLTRLMSTRWLFVTAMTGFVAASAACAASHTYWLLYGFRFIQGLFGGAIIPVIFSAVFLMFPSRQQTIATVIGGGFAMLAPAVGPFVGGWITETLSWHWLFLVNVAPGLAMAAVAGLVVHLDKPDWAQWKQLDWIALVAACVFLATLELALKESPRQGWSSGVAVAMIGACVVAGLICLQRSRRPDPLIDLSVFTDRTFALGAWYSFVLGMALFGATYLLPLYLGLVRQHGPLEIGIIMIVTGAAQLATSPAATLLEQRAPARLLTAVGYSLFAAGLLWNGMATPRWDFHELVAPQLLRGAAVLLCLLPTTRLALGQLPADRIAHGSSLFNLMRNIGGAVGLALVDTVIENRPATHATQIVTRLQAGDRAMAAFVGLPLDRFHGEALGPIDETTRQIVEPLVSAAAAVMSFNDAWRLLGSVVLLSLLVLPFMKAPATNSGV